MGFSSYTQILAFDLCKKKLMKSPDPDAILLSPDNLYIFSLKQRRQIPFKLQRALHSHPENTRGNISIPASHTESESTETNTLRPVLY